MKLEVELQPTLGSLGQFLLTNIILSKLSDYKQYLFKFVRILANQKILLVSIWKTNNAKDLMTKKCHSWK
jgi:hypothetical protein